MTTLLAAVLLAQSASPRPQLAKGQEVAYKVTMTYRDVQEPDVVTKQEWRLGYKGDERGLVGTRRLLKMNVDGNEIKLDKVEDETWTEVRNMRWQVMARTVKNDEDREKRRWIRVFDFSFPASALRRGLSWTSTDEQDDLPRLTTTYTVENVGDQGLQIKFASAESGQGARQWSGTMLCDRRTGWPKEVHGTIERYVFPDDEERRTHRVEYTAHQVVK
ncbi:MAG: hypothetical protein KF857_02840 [Fimbriimonadaceae bacterium]|nr:hypothetical protein [Fimbriimonadaceae bacterium]